MGFQNPNNQIMLPDQSGVISSMVTIAGTIATIVTIVSVVTVKNAHEKNRN